MLSDQAMPRRLRAKAAAPPRLTDDELQRRQHAAEAAVCKAEAAALDELMRLEWLRSQARLWQGDPPPEEGR